MKPYSRYSDHTLTRLIAQKEKLAGLTDETVDNFYSCAVCQSIVPNHICIITPERPGLCGGISWPGAAAVYELEPTGPHKPIKKEGLLDAEKGVWGSLNDFVCRHTNQTVHICSLYSLFAYPLTSGRFFECITGVVPEANGVMAAFREDGGLTPAGMRFSELADFIGGDRQTPGFMGHSRNYLLSGKYIRNEGGLTRLIWMPEALKKDLEVPLRRLSLNMGLGASFPEKIADERIGRRIEEILPFLEKKKHPALSMKPLF